MPIEVRELVIRTSIKNEEIQNKSSISQNELNNLKKELLEDCIDEVHKILEQKLQR